MGLSIVISNSLCEFLCQWWLHDPCLYVILDAESSLARDTADRNHEWNFCWYAIGRHDVELTFCTTQVFFFYSYMYKFSNTDTIYVSCWFVTFHTTFLECVFIFKLINNGKIQLKTWPIRLIGFHKWKSKPETWNVQLESSLLLWNEWKTCIMFLIGIQKLLSTNASALDNCIEES